MQTQYKKYINNTKLIHNHTNNTTIFKIIQKTIQEQYKPIHKHTKQYNNNTKLIQNTTKPIQTQYTTIQKAARHHFALFYHFCIVLQFLHRFIFLHNLCIILHYFCIILSILHYFIIVALFRIQNRYKITQVILHNTK